MDNFQCKYSNYSKALLRLKEAVKISEPDDIHIDGIVQRFEFTFELAIQTLKAYLKFTCISEYIDEPTDILKIAFQEGIIYDGELWLEMLETKNSTLEGNYYEESRKIYNDIKNTYVSLLEKLSSKLNRGE